MSLEMVQQRVTYAQDAPFHRYENMMIEGVKRGRGRPKK